MVSFVLSQVWRALFNGDSVLSLRLFVQLAHGSALLWLSLTNIYVFVAMDIFTLILFFQFFDIHRIPVCRKIHLLELYVVILFTIKETSWTIFCVITYK